MTHRPLLTSLALLLCFTALACGGDDQDASNNNTQTDPDQGNKVVDMGTNTGGGTGTGGPNTSMTSGTNANVPCAPPLVVTELKRFAVPFQRLQIKPSGGTGRYKFDLLLNNSEASLNTLTGDYIAGRQPSQTDTVALSDAGCQGGLTVEIDVLEGMLVAPSEPQIQPGESIAFEVQKGSGEFSYELRQNETGATIQDNLYTAGDRPGRDLLTVIDKKTLEEVEVAISVSPSFVFSALTPTVAMPVGHTHKLQTLGGSGEIEATFSGEAISFKDGVFEAKAPGRTEVILTDKFTKQTAMLTVESVAHQGFENVVAGDLGAMARVLTQDLDGDGIKDAVVAVSESKLNGWYSGTLFIYKGASTGMSKEPVQVIRGLNESDRFGTDIAIGDVNNDGNPDLFVGAYGADVGNVNAGGVYYFKGKSTGFFEEKSSAVYAGINSSDQLGYSVALCDFNGDGTLDLASGAITGEDRNASPVRSNQGQVYVYLNSGGILPQQPSMTVQGKALDGTGGWENSANLQLGRSIRPGDFNGDGKCDLAVGAEVIEGGRAYLYLGRGPSGTSAGGLSTEPVLAIESTRVNPANSLPYPSRLGYRVLLADVNNDGKDDFFVGAYNDNAPNAQGTPQNAAGSVYMFKGEMLEDKPANAFVNQGDADWAVSGNSSSDYMGYDLNTGDLNSDGTADLFITASIDEVSGKTGGSAGVVHAFYGSPTFDAQAMPEADLLIAGKDQPSLFGTGVGTLDDANGDGVSELFIYAPRDLTLGYYSGRPYYLKSGDAFEDISQGDGLEMPVAAAGSQAGESVAFVDDLNGDGRAELVVGAPYYERIGEFASGYYTGAIFLYESTPEGYSKMPTQILQGFPSNSSSDRLGQAVTNLGDFNGDGIPDLAVVSRYEDRGSRYGSALMGGEFGNGTWANNTCEPPTPANATADIGAVYVFLGTRKGLVHDTPAFIIHGPQRSQRIDKVIGNLDVNGDGKKDFIYSSPAWDSPEVVNPGGFGVVYGRAVGTAVDEITKITPLCGPDYLYLGANRDDQLGNSLTSLGDLNKDGCDDFAVGGAFSDLRFSNQGQTRVFVSTKTAGTCPIASFKEVALAPGNSSVLSGFSLAGGEDLNGDSVNDLVIGGYGYRVGANSVGAAWFIDGAYLTGLVTSEGTALRSGTPLVAEDLHPFSNGEPVLIPGFNPGDLFGYSMAMLPSAGGKPAAILVGARDANFSGELAAGGAVLLSFEGGKFIPTALFSSESTSPHASRAGTSVGATRHADGSSSFAVGAPRAYSNGTDQGTAFVFSMP